MRHAHAGLIGFFLFTVVKDRECSGPKNACHTTSKMQTDRLLGKAKEMLMEHVLAMSNVRYFSH